MRDFFADLWYKIIYAPVAELADAHGLGPCLARGRGSSPLGSTKTNTAHDVCGVCFCLRLLCFAFLYGTFRSGLCYFGYFYQKHAFVH